MAEDGCKPIGRAGGQCQLAFADFNANFKVIVVIRVVLIVLTSLFFVNLFYSDSYNLTKALVFGALVYQVYSLIKFIDKTNHELAGFLESIKYDDFSLDHRLGPQPIPIRSDDRWRNIR